MQSEFTFLLLSHRNVAFRDSCFNIFNMTNNFDVRIQIVGHSVVVYRFLLLVPLICGESCVVSFFVLLCTKRICVLSSFAIISLERAGCFTLIVF